MKKIFLMLTAMVFCISIVHAQCNFKGVNKRLLRNTTAIEGLPKIESATKSKNLFDKLNFISAFSFVQSTDKNYLYLYFIRKNSKRYTLNANTPLTLITKSGKRIQLNPERNYTGKFKLNVFWIGAFYEISNDDLAVLAKDEVLSLKLMVDSRKKMRGGIGLDAGGWYYDEELKKSCYQTRIKAASKRKNIMKMANCMLSKIE